MNQNSGTDPSTRTDPAARTTRFERIRCAVDARGALFEPIDDSRLREQRNAHVVLTAPGAIRGNHLHRLSTETTVVCGPARVRYREGAQVQTVDVPPAEAWRFVFPPGVPHAYQNTGTGTMVLVSFSTQPHDPGAPDTEREAIL
jgi:dTDP-4-dehydrorhamnose 3,5-epimerase-like enzyme